MTENDVDIDSSSESVDELVYFTYIICAHDTVDIIGDDTDGVRLECSPSKIPWNRLILVKIF